MGDTRLTGFATRPAGRVDKAELEHRIYTAVRFVEVLETDVSRIHTEVATDGRSAELELELARALRALGIVDEALRQADRLAAS